MFNIGEIQKNIKFILSQKERTENIIVRHPEDPNAEKNLRPVVSKFEETIEILSKASDLEVENANLSQEIRSLKKQVERKEEAFRDMSLTSDEVRDLPEELKNQLLISDAEQLEFEILEIFKSKGGSLSLDQVIVYYYNNVGEIIERQKMNQRIYRLVQKNSLSPIEGKKGCYTIYQQPDMFNADGKSETTKKPVADVSDLVGKIKSG